MFIIGEDIAVSEEIFDTEFVCNLSKCKGACCVEGYFGAPLESDEIQKISSIIEEIIPFMSPAGKEKLAKDGFHEIDDDGDEVTTCIDHADCVFVVKEQGIYKCSIENAYNAGKIDFIKPISCHLYPIRISNLNHYTALNYSQWDICDDACALGTSLKVPVYQFLKVPIIRRFGDAFFQELQTIEKEWKKISGK